MTNKAVFLDRDNTIIEDPGYISSPDQVKLLPGAAGALKDLSRLGYKLIIITNQSAVARGMVTEEGLAKIHQRLERLLADQKAYIDNIYYCPYHPEGVVAEYCKESDLRKPNPGMILQAAEDMQIDLENSWMIGDSYRDIAAGKSAGCKTILINSPVNPPLKKPNDPLPNYEAVNIRESANIIKMYHTKKSKSPAAGSKKTTKNQPAQAVQPNADKKKQALSQTKPTPTQKPEIKQRAKKEEKTEISQAREDMNFTQKKNAQADQGNNELLLREILNHLKHQSRKDHYEEFSLLKLFAGIIQASVIFCLIVAVWITIGHAKTELSVFKPLAFAAVLQMTCLTLYVMDEKK